MKLALITPKGVLFGSDPEVAGFFKEILSKTAHDPFIPKYSSWSGPSLGLLIVAALTPPDFEIVYLDENYEQIDFSVRYDLVALSAMTQQATRAYEIADEFRRRNVKVVIGGIHATVMENEAGEHADAVVIGEAEDTWPDLINDLVQGTLQRIYRSTVPADLTRSPKPRYDLLKKYDYKMIWVQTTRGCPRDCEFCSASKVYGKVFRHKRIDQVLDEVRVVQGLWNRPFINFADDNMFLDRSYGGELVRALGTLGVQWTAQSDLAIGEDDVLLDQLRESGCKVLFIGFETLSKGNRLDSHGWKMKKIETYPAVISKIQSRGIGILGAFIVGLDDDDRSVFDSLYVFIRENLLYAAQVTVLTPLPGTRLRQRLQEAGRIISSDWKRYTFVDVNFTPKKMSVEELQAGILDLYQRIYSKEARSAVLKHFKQIYRTLRRVRAGSGQ